ncbi:hypothetical protein N9322_01110 [bacterium]|jgi:tRNA(Ile2) C34 agmatinyltransferase TiaS|nr:hypothetical protein [bacterium]
MTEENIIKCPQCGATETESKGFDATCSYCGHQFKSEETKQASGNAHEAINDIEDALTELKAFSFPSFFEKFIYCCTLGIFYFIRRMNKKDFPVLVANLEQKLKHLKTYHSDNKKIQTIHEDALNSLSDYRSGYTRKKVTNTIINIVVGIVFVLFLFLIFI